MPFMAAIKGGCAVGSIIFHRLEMRYKFQAEGHPKNYVIIATKDKV